jgi:hypothetical protein
VRTYPAMLLLPNTGHTTLLSFLLSLPLDTSGNCEELRLETKLLQHLSLLLELSVCFWCLRFGVQVLQIRLVLCSWGLQFVPIRECNPSSKHSNRRGSKLQEEEEEEELCNCKLVCVGKGWLEFRRYNLPGWYMSLVSNFKCTICAIYPLYRSMLQDMLKDRPGD